MNTLKNVTTNPEYIYVRPQETSRARAEDENDFFVIENDDYDKVQGENFPTVTIEEEGPVSVHRKPKGIILSWANIQGGNISLLKSNLVSPKLCFPNLVVNWHCGYISKNVTPYRLLMPYDTRNIKHGRQNLNKMR